MSKFQSSKYPALKSPNCSSASATQRQWLKVTPSWSPLFTLTIAGSITDDQDDQNQRRKRKIIAFASVLCGQYVNMCHRAQMLLMNSAIQTFSVMSAAPPLQQPTKKQRITVAEVERKIMAFCGRGCGLRSQRTRNVHNVHLIMHGYILMWTEIRHVVVDIWYQLLMAISTLTHSSWD